MAKQWRARFVVSQVFQHLSPKRKGQVYTFNPVRLREASGHAHNREPCAECGSQKAPRWSFLRLIIDHHGWLSLSEVACSQCKAPLCALLSSESGQLARKREHILAWGQVWTEEMH